MTILHDISPGGMVFWFSTPGYTRTYVNGQPLNVVVVNIRSGLSTLYAMAGLSISRIETARFGERGIGQLALAGLEI